MRKIILAAAVLALAASPAGAKSWQWNALDIGSGSVTVIASGATCNLAKSIAAARKAGAGAASPAFTLKAVDDATACPPKAKAPTPAT